jgi:D-alanyl-D-alanine dipeptidase
MYKSSLLFLLFSFSILLATPPEGFVYLKDVAPEIQKSLRYYSDENFVGKKINGYNAPKIIITKQAAIALKNANKKLLEQGYELVVYDAYRPQMAVDHFVAWGKDNSSSKKNEYYPNLNKQEVFSRGFVATKSKHSRGSTVDITIIERGKKVCPIKKIPRGEYIFLDDCTVDMGMHFDFFGEESWSISTLVADSYNQKRAFLKKIMEEHGFLGAQGEWWHFTLINEPFPTTYFTFVVE